VTGVRFPAGPREPLDEAGTTTARKGAIAEHSVATEVVEVPSRFDSGLFLPGVGCWYPIDVLSVGH
jgi:hypothetical protein